MPIISPSPTKPPPLPLSAEMTAKIRLGKYKEREGRTSDNDCARCVRLVPDQDGKSVEPANKLNQPSTTPWGTREDWESLLGLGRQAREERIDWLLQHLPAVSEPDSTASSFSSTSSDDSLDSCVYLCFKGSRLNLINQLITSPETRFHAGWMFLRYHYLVGMGKKLGVGIDLERRPIYSENMTWDAAMASLAISVKFHRDFLSPLLPILAAEYMDISPHRMGYQAFELAQRRMLSVFSYELGVTPQPFLDQIWMALPSLRKLLRFDGGWNQAKKETWRILLNSLYAPDVMKFLVSVLTTTALAKAIISVLAQQYYYNSDWNSCSNFTRTVQDGCSTSKIAPRFDIAAREDAGEVIIDIQAVVGISDTEFEECRCWLDMLGR